MPFHSTILPPGSLGFLWRALLLVIMVGWSARLGMAEWHYGAAFRSGQTNTEIARHLRAAGELYPFDRRFREALASAETIERKENH